MAGEAATSDANQSRRAEQEPEEEEERGGPRGFVGKNKNLRDFIVNGNFPLIQSSDEKMVKIKVVELFKSYNFALGLKFRKIKHTVLFYHFALNLKNYISFVLMV
jgi:hypothetical protein